MSSWKRQDCAAELADVLDFAVLAALSDGPFGQRGIPDVVRSLCRPWLHPTTRVIHTRLARHRCAGCIAPHADADLILTSQGRSLLHKLIADGIETVPHGFAELCESLRLGLATRLEPRERAVMHAHLLRARARCLAAQRRRLAAQAAMRDVVRRSRRNGVATAELRLAALRGLLGEHASGDSGEPGVTV